MIRPSFARGPGGRLSVFSGCWLLSIGSLLCGCTVPLFDKSETPDLENEALSDADRETWLVGEMTRPFGMTYLKVESVALVSELANTGSNPPPSTELDMLKGEMLANKVYRPNEILASPTTSLVLVRGFLPPGVRKGDTFDVEVRTAPRSETTSLRGGWLMPCRLKEIQVLGNSVHTGHLMATAEGRVIVDGVYASTPRGARENEDEANERKVLDVRGRVLGGGIAKTNRALGLTVTSEHHSVKISRAIGAAINRRFHEFESGGIKKGVAEPKRDDFIEITPHSLYKHNLSRYMRVIANIAVNESPSDQLRRLETLERQLLDRVSAPVAALRLEAIGPEAVETLKKGLASESREVRFYAAEALAYMDVAEAAEHLADAAVHEPALRWHAFAALTVMKDLAAYDVLNNLLHVDNAETRYGAFWSLRIRYHSDPLVRGEVLGEEFAYHVLPTTGSPMIHLTRSRRPELVLFGHEQTISSSAVLSAGRNILIKGTGPGSIKITRFQAGQENLEVVCSNKVDDVVRGVVEVGGGYAEVIQALMEASDKQSLETKIAIDASPRPGKYYRAGGPDDVDALDEEVASLDLPVEEGGEQGADQGAEPAPDGEGEVIDSSDSSARDGAGESLSRAHNPLPEVFQRRSGEGDDRWGRESDFAVDATPEAPKQGFFDKMKGWFKE